MSIIFLKKRKSIDYYEVKSERPQPVSHVCLPQPISQLYQRLTVYNISFHIFSM